MGKLFTPLFLCVCLLWVVAILAPVSLTLRSLARVSQKVLQRTKVQVFGRATQTDSVQKTCSTQIRMQTTKCNRAHCFLLSRLSHCHCVSASFVVYVALGMRMRCGLIWFARDVS